jgi:MazG family protein
VTAGEQFQQLLEIMARLRSPDGCPWDREQTFDSIKPYTLEETYEVLDAIDRRDWPGLSEELGDFLLQAAFYAQMASEAGLFRMEDCLTAINEKLVRRHPHVFGTVDARTADQVKQNWDAIKATEKKDRSSQMLLDPIPRGQPALVESLQISSKAAKAGFEWPDITGVLDKMTEELEELAEARETASLEKIEHEIGDLLFTLVNVARFLKIDPEQALRKTNARFRNRFGHVEQSLRGQGKTLESASLDDMEALWQQAKDGE